MEIGEVKTISFSLKSLSVTFFRNCCTICWNTSLKLNYFIESNDRREFTQIAGRICCPTALWNYNQGRFREEKRLKVEFGSKKLRWWTKCREKRCRSCREWVEYDLQSLPRASTDPSVLFVFALSPKICRLSKSPWPPPGSESNWKRLVHETTSGAIFSAGSYSFSLSF